MNTNGGLLLAFLPQFLAPGSGQVAQQMAVLGLTFAGFGLCFLIALGYVTTTAILLRSMALAGDPPT